MGIQINLAKPAKPRRNTVKSSWSLKTMFGLLLIVATIATLGYFAAPEIKESKLLQSRAERIFEYDRSHPNALSNSEVMRLSVALGFGDHNGAKILLAKLEKQI